MSEALAYAPVTERRRFWDLTWSLAVTQFKLRYFGNALGYFWTLAKPLLLFGVLYFAFTVVIRFGEGIAHYPAYLIAAIVLYTYFADATTRAVTSLVDHEHLIRKVPMPLITIPLSISLHAGFNLVLNLIAVLFFVLISGVPITLSWLEFPLLVAILIVFSTAVGALVANLYVPFRDMLPIWEVVTQIAFWGTPIIYTVESLPDSIREPMMINPLATIMVEMRHSLIDPSAPSAAEAIGGAGLLLVPAGIVVGLLALSVYLHRHITQLVAERL
jgi:ABC-2 type transport system permease protein